MSNRVTILAFCVLMSVSCSSKTDEQGYVRLPGSLDLSVIRTPQGTLAEYKRTAVLSSNGKQIAFWELFPDTGGTQRLNVYLLDNGRILLQDRIESHEIDPMAKSMTEVEGSTSKGKYLGCFKVDSNAHWRFFPIQESQEVKISGDGRVE